MAYTDIDKPTDYFNTVLYTGNGSTQSVTGVGFQPDWVWLKDRTNAYSHQLTDVIRGNTKYLNSDGTDAEGTASDRVTSFDSDGFSLGSYVGTNTNTANYASWNWLAGGTASSNTDGSITSQVSASTTSGFSIVSYTGTGSAATIGHGLGTTPSMIIVKLRSSTGNWQVYHQSLGNTKAIPLNTTDTPVTNSGFWNNTSPTSSVFSLGTGYADNTNSNGGTYIAYCFAEKKGFSKIGSYTGNGSTDGPFIYTGFKPAFVLIKRTNSAGNNWQLYDNKRNAFNVINNVLFPNLSDAEATQSTTNIDMLSQGFKLRGNSATVNGSGDSYIYMAFAENPFVSSTGTPVTAR